MRRLVALFLYVLVGLSLGLGSLAHASEGAACVEATAASSIDHHDGDRDQVPADADKGYPHHHGGCHGHHVGVPLAADTLALTSGRRMAPVARNSDPRAPALSDTALRPPQA